MCGIAGIIGSNASQNCILNMIQTMNHRGPDGNGIFVDNQIVLGHTRLSILDLSNHASQPMSTEDKRYTIIFNGEIYNHLELRKTFLVGETFFSNSDTETILKLYRKYGSTMLEFLRGMFAFVIYDKIKKNIFGARDRMGIKPFLYFKDNDNFIFASELKTILSSELIDNEVEPTALRHLMMYGSIQYPFTYIKNVFTLASAHFFNFKNGKLKIEPYWDYPTETNHKINFEDAKSEFKKLFEDSINLTLLSDRKVGLFLSGGLDSVSILAALKHLDKQNIETFTIGFSDNHKKYFSEIESAKSIANHFGFVNKNAIANSDRLNDRIIDFALNSDQPSIDGFNTYLVSNKSKQNLVVALSGLGGDELMLGYPRNINLYNKSNSLFKLTSSYSDKILLNSLYNETDDSLYKRRLQKFLGNPKNLKLHYWASRCMNNPGYVNNSLLDRSFSKKYEEDIADFYKFDNGYESNYFNKISYYEMKTFMERQLLRDMDVASMLNGIEVRFPIIDHKVVEFLFSLPAQYKYNPVSKNQNNATGITSYSESGMKYILTKTYESELPDNFLNSKKQGFQLPIYQWFKDAFQEELLDTLTSGYYVQKGFQLQELEKLKKALQVGEFNSNHYLLTMIAAFDKQ